VQGNLRRLFFWLMLGRMRWLVLIASLASWLAIAQDSGLSAAACNVITQPVDVNAQGEFVQPPATLEECMIASGIVSKLLGMDRNEFERTVNVTGIPGPIQTHIGPIAGPGDPWNTTHVLSEELPEKQHIATWASPALIVVVYRSLEISGPTTNVLVADLESLKACNFPRWPVGDGSGTMSIIEIQNVLEPGLLGNQATPTCYLKPLTLD